MRVGIHFDQINLILEFKRNRLRFVARVTILTIIKQDIKKDKNIVVQWILISTEYWLHFQVSTTIENQFLFLETRM